MQSYQFINYNDKTNSEHIKRHANHNAILCFDFEDSITPSDKQFYRKCFNHIIENLTPSVPEAKIGLRINNDHSELTRDLNTISNHHFNSIFFPKVETVEDIEYARMTLIQHNVTFDELIPIIETKAALSNLDNIVKATLPKVNFFGFGHCDYNLSINAFPFFHQDSIEYWKWVNRICSIILPKGFGLINSAYLDLHNDLFFKSMLQHLYDIFGEKAAQTALTNRQSKLIKNFNPATNHISFNKLIKHRLDLGVPESFDKQLINDFEKDRNNKAFSILEKNKVMISPHEYLAAKSYLKKIRLKSINLTFVGGCFPVQYDMLIEDIFHQRLKRKIENEYQVELNINIIRYERFKTCLDKIRKYHKSNPIDILVFHIRPEPFLRLVKIYYRFINHNGKLRHSLNISFLKILNPEKFDILFSERAVNPQLNQRERWLHKLLVDLNYRVGRLFGNVKYAQKKYFELTANILEYCKNSNIKPIILGIGCRNNTSYAPTLCYNLDNNLKIRLKGQNISFIEGFNKNSENISQFFQEDGIHASEKYHELISEKLFLEIRKEIKITSNSMGNNIML